MPDPDPLEYPDAVWPDDDEALPEIVGGPGIPVPLMPESAYGPDSTPLPDPETDPSKALPPPPQDAPQDPDADA